MTTHVEEAAPTPPKAEEAKTASKNAIESIVVLWPLILGLAFGRAGLIAACYGSYENTDEGLFTDGAMFVSLAALLIPFVIITLRKKEMGQTLGELSRTHLHRAGDGHHRRHRRGEPFHARELRLEVFAQRRVHHHRIGGDVLLA